MISENVFVETFTDIVPSHRVPLADKEEVDEALAYVDAVLDSYFDSMNGDPLVDSNWINDHIMMFGDWLYNRLPYVNESRFPREFPKRRIIQEYMMLCVQEYIAECENTLEHLPLPPGAVQLAEKISDLAALSPKSICVSVDTPGHEMPYEIEFPECSPDEFQAFIAVQNDMPVELSNPVACRMLLQRALFLSSLECMASPTASIAIGINGGVGPESANADVSLGGFAFSYGRYAALSPENIGVVTGKLNDFEAREQAALVNLDIRAEYEIDVANLVNSLARSFSNVMANIMSFHDHTDLIMGMIGFSTFFDVSYDDPSELYTEDVETHAMLLSDGTAMLPQPGWFSAPYIFEQVHSATLGGATAEACSVSMAACLLEAAIRLMQDDNFEHVAEIIEDFGDFVELNREKYDFDDMIIAKAVDYYLYLDARKHETLFLDVYRDMTPELKNEIDSIVEVVNLNAAYTRKVVVLERIEPQSAIEGDASHDGEGPLMNGESLSAHIMMLAPYEEDTDELLRAMCTRCLCSVSPVTMFFALEDSHTLSQLGGVSWKNGKWENIAKREIEEVFAGSNIGQILDVNVIHGYEHLGFQHKTSDDE